MLLGFYSHLMSVWSGLRARMQKEDGVLATEYVILLVLIALALVVGATALGVSINNKLQAASTCVTNLSSTC
jgi:pilus assembly protein Flp/PilA